MLLAVAALALPRGLVHEISVLGHELDSIIDSVQLRGASDNERERTSLATAVELSNLATLANKYLGTEGGTFEDGTALFDANAPLASVLARAYGPSAIGRAEGSSTTKTCLILYSGYWAPSGSNQVQACTAPLADMYDDPKPQILAETYLGVKMKAADAAGNSPSMDEWRIASQGLVQNALMLGVSDVYICIVGTGGAVLDASVFYDTELPTLRNLIGISPYRQPGQIYIVSTVGQVADLAERKTTTTPKLDLAKFVDHNVQERIDEAGRHYVDLNPWSPRAAEVMATINE